MPTPRLLQVVLAVFDEAAGPLLAGQLRKLGCACEMADSVAGFESIVRARTPDLIVVELGKDAMSLERTTRYAATAPLIALAPPDPEVFFRAAKAGVEAVYPLPLDPLEYGRKLQEICSRIQAGPRQDGAIPEAAFPGQPGGNKSLHATIPSLFAASEEMAEVREMIEKVAPTSAAVLIRGESGVGKELAARLIHSWSPRAERAFVKVNCAAIPNELLESELFGYEAGAFTGAVKGKPGKFELADGGTIFLDEIGEMHPMLQAKLLHVLQDGDFARLGSKRDLSVDVRVICATNQQLDQLVASGQFREDLYYRVNVVTVSLPPLRARKREIPVLLDYFVRRYSVIYGKPCAPFTPAAIEALTEYEWPGNIRELENLCKRYVIVGNAGQMLRELNARRSDRDSVRAADEGGAASALLSGSVADGSANGKASAPSLLEIGRRAAWAAERAAIEEMLRETRWNRREAARRLQISYKALLNKIQTMEEESESLEVASR
jgi:transcriptional regulator with PAS, ATPase and Fis domain